jgi:hypothetical protein
MVQGLAIVKLSREVCLRALAGRIELSLSSVVLKKWKVEDKERDI